MQKLITGIVMFILFALMYACDPNAERNAEIKRFESFGRGDTLGPVCSFVYKDGYEAGQELAAAQRPFNLSHDSTEGCNLLYVDGFKAGYSQKRAAMEKEEITFMRIVATVPVQKGLTYSEYIDPLRAQGARISATDQCNGFEFETTPYEFDQPIKFPEGVKEIQICGWEKEEPHDSLSVMKENFEREGGNYDHLKVIRQVKTRFGGYAGDVINKLAFDKADFNSTLLCNGWYETDEVPAGTIIKFCI